MRGVIGSGLLDMMQADNTDLHNEPRRGCRSA
jgi:hypothetical protein